MQFKTLALGAITGVSMTITALTPAIQPAEAQGSHHPSVTPIYCDKCNELSASGGFSKFVTLPNHGLELTFGETNLTFCTYVGARVDAQPGASHWSVNMQSQGGHPFFVTAFENSTGTHYTPALSSYSNVNGNIQATFNGPALGFPSFTKLFIYDNGFNSGQVPFAKPDVPVIGFTDTIDLSSGGIQINSFYPIAHMVSAVEDCSGIFSNLNK